MTVIFRYAGDSSLVLLSLSSVFFDPVDSMLWFYGIDGSSWFCSVDRCKADYIIRSLSRRGHGDISSEISCWEWVGE